MYIISRTHSHNQSAVMVVGQTHTSWLKNMIEKCVHWTLSSKNTAVVFCRARLFSLFVCAQPEYAELSSFSCILEISRRNSFLPVERASNCLRKQKSLQTATNHRQYSAAKK